MARKSKSDRIHEILILNPALNRNDPRIDQLINGEDLLRKAQRAARNSPITVATGTGSKRSPEWVAVESAEKSVRRLRNDLGIDRVSVKRSERAGIRVKRSPKAQAIIEQQGYRYSEMADLMPGLASGWAAYGIVAEDLPEDRQERFRRDLENAARVDTPEAVRARFLQYSMV